MPASLRASTCSNRSPSSLYRKPPPPSVNSAVSAASNSAARFPGVGNSRTSSQVIRIDLVNRHVLGDLQNGQVFLDQLPCLGRQFFMGGQYPAIAAAMGDVHAAQPGVLAAMRIEAFIRRQGFPEDLHALELRLEFAARLTVGQPAKALHQAGPRVFDLDALEKLLAPGDFRRHLRLEVLPIDGRFLDDFLVEIQRPLQVLEHAEVIDDNAGFLAPSPAAAGWCGPSLEASCGRAAACRGTSPARWGRRSRSAAGRRRSGFSAAAPTCSGHRRTCRGSTSPIDSASA